MRLATLVNQYTNEQAPWALIESDRERAGTVLYVALRAIDSLKMIFTPFLPFSSQTLHELLGYEGTIAGPLELREVGGDEGDEHEVLTGEYDTWVGSWSPSELPAGQELKKPSPLFKKLDPGRGRSRGARAHAKAGSRGVIDTHAHLDACADRPSALIRRARSAGVDRIVTVGTGIESSQVALELAELHEEVFAALGIDPHQAGDAEAGRVDELRELLQHEQAVAVGETGLDYFRDRAPRDRQRKLFEAQLELAAELGKPVVIHTRDAEADTADVLSGFEGTVVMHCFSSPGLLDTVLERGYYVSFAGNVTYPKASDLRAAAAQVPAERILAETDSPYLAPQARRGRPNEPANVVLTVAELAKIRGVDPDELGEHRSPRTPPAAFSLP